MADMTNFAAEMQAIEFSYDGQSLMNFTCAFERGVTTAILGNSGSGKSTLLALIAGFERPASGTVILNGADQTHVPPSERPLSMVFQSNNLFAHLSVEKNVGLGIAPSLNLSAAQHDQVEKALGDVGLAGYGARLPAQLSGGERQRVALARVLVRQKPILLLDEAFASLGPGLREDMLDLVSALAKNNALTTLMVTHSPEDALRIAQNMIFVNDGTVLLSGETGVLLGDDTQNAQIRTYLGLTDKPT